GWPIEDVYREQSNVTLAPNLQGKLLLAHGDVDENVPVSATLQLAGALIEANKDFDLIIMPNQTHGMGRHPYFIRKRWDFFVEHLLGVEPPTGYEIEADRTGG
ncbi:MAG: prolyl oligopeptidase family serine peptidase, partial [Gemmatimonadetes bacterium]|nr:prolyl oligopeptidase family serine peptidase [Gemmatimonadota bacterium]